MAESKKLQNYFNDFLPQRYLEFRRKAHELTSNEAVVAELIRACCEGTEVKAIKMTFERILGKPEKVIVIKRTVVRTLYVDARTKALKPVVDDRVKDEVRVLPTDNKVVVSADNAPGLLLKKRMDEIGQKPREYSYQVLDNKDQHEVSEVIVANLYGMAMRGENLSAIELLFDYLDGAVADVIRLEGEDTVVIENYADVAPFEAVQGEDGVFYVDIQAVK